MDVLQELFLMQQSWSTLFSVTNKLQATGDRYFQKLTVRQVMVLIAIIHLSEDQTTLNNIARKLGTTKQSVKQLITAMEKKGYVIAVTSPTDKRALNVHITKLGKETLLACGELSLEYFANVFHEFSTEELQVLWNLLKKLYRFDGKEQDGFEENVNYGTENGFSDSQLQAIQKFRERRVHDANGQTVINRKASQNEK